MSDTLAIWGFNVNGQIKRIDFGDVPVRSSGDIRFRVRNLSARYSATGVTVAFDDDPDPAWQLYLSQDGTTFTASLNLGTLPAGAISAPIWIRRVTPSDTSPATFTCRLAVTATSWQQPTS